MDMLQIQDKTIFYHASSSEAYKKGLLYNLNHRVRHFEFDSDKLIINAIVRGSEDYDVSIYFDNKGDIQDYECTCPAYYNYSGACKHIVAVMKMAQGELLKYKYINPRGNRPANRPLLHRLPANGNRFPHRPESSPRSSGLFSPGRNPDTQYMASQWFSLLHDTAHTSEH